MKFGCRLLKCQVAEVVRAAFGAVMLFSAIYDGVSGNNFGKVSRDGISGNNLSKVSSSEQRDNARLLYPFGNNIRLRYSIPGREERPQDNPISDPDSSNGVSLNGNPDTGSVAQEGRPINIPTLNSAIGIVKKSDVGSRKMQKAYLARDWCRIDLEGRKQVKWDMQNWDHIDEEKIARIKSFIEFALGNYVQGKKGYSSSSDSDSLKKTKFNTLPDEGKSLLTQYIMLILTGAHYLQPGLESSDWEDKLKWLNESTLKDVIESVKAKPKEETITAFDSIRSFQAQQSEDSYNKFVNFCSNYPSVSKDPGVNLIDALVESLSECLDADKKNVLGISKEYQRIIEIMPKESGFAMQKLDNFIEESLGFEPFSDAHLAYTLLLNNFYLSGLKHSDYAVKNRVMPEVDSKVNFIIRYFVYSGIMDSIGADKIIHALVENLSRGQVGLEYFATSLCKLIIDHTNKLATKEAMLADLTARIKNCFKVCDDLYNRADFEKEPSDLQIYKFIPFIKNWWDVDSANIEKSENFIKLVIYYYAKKGCTNIGSMPIEVREFIRPYVMLIQKGCPFAEYTDGILNADISNVVEQVERMNGNIGPVDGVTAVQDSVSDGKFNVDVDPEYIIELQRALKEAGKKPWDDAGDSECSYLPSQESNHHFWPLPRDIKISLTYLPWAKEFIKAFFAHYPKIITSYNLERLRPYAMMLLKGDSSDDHQEEIIGKSLEDFLGHKN